MHLCKITGYETEQLSHFKDHLKSKAYNLAYDKATNPNSEGYIAPGRCISSTNKGGRYLILPIYETMETPAKNEKYQVRYISFKKN